MKFLKFTLITISFFGLISCKSSGGGNDTDTTKPTVTLTSPTSSTVVAAGNNLNVSASLLDNKSLSSYNILIAFTNATAMKSVVEFAFNSNSDLDANGNALPTISGTSSNLNFNIAVDENAKPGNYKFTLKVKDESGNETVKEVIFQITGS